ncbi:MAG: response regulator transcription factor, partial [Chloroflexi bacterium]|nr:response regulator transcription factor [Chloroflexota bacterium]
TDEYIFDAIDAGAKGYLLKDASREELFQAVRTVHRGESLIEPGVASRVLDRLAQFSRQAGRSGGPQSLSERELEVLRLMAAGAANKNIASELSISESTVKYHLRNILDKLHLENRAQVIAYASRRGFGTT